MMRYLIAGSLVCCTALFAGADAIQVNGVTYDPVYITETDSMYYIQIPTEGRAFSVLKRSVPQEHVQIDPDPVARQALFTKFKKNRIKSAPPAKSPTQPAIPIPTRQQSTITPSANFPIDSPESPKTPLDIPLDINPTQEHATKNPGVLDFNPYPMDKDAERGIYEKQSLVDEKGTKKLVLKGSVQKDPAREAYLQQYYEEERLKAEEAGRELRDYLLEQRRIEAEIERDAIQADIQRMEVEEERLRAMPRYHLHGYRYPAYIGMPPSGDAPYPEEEGSPAAPVNPPENKMSFQTLSGTHGGNYTGASHGGEYGVENEE